MTSFEMVGAHVAKWLAELQPHPTARLDVERLLQHVTGWPNSTWRAFPEKMLTQAQVQTLDSLINRRKKGEPIAYLIQEQGFWDLTLCVNEHTLIPRPETEMLVQHLLELWGPDTIRHVVDLGTGSGAIALALAKARPEWSVCGIDQSLEALQVARANAQKLHLSHRVRWLQSHWYDALENTKWDAIVSNPPYIAATEPHPNQGDCRFEPKTALVSGETGLECLAHIIENAANHLKPGGLLLLEHGYQQQPAVVMGLEAAGFQNIQSFLDLNKHPRVVVAQWK